MRLIRGGILLVALLSSLPAQAQPPAQPQPCGMPQFTPASREPNLFTPAQAVQLADIFWRSQRPQVNLVGDPALVGYLQAIADRMVAVAGAQPVRVAVIDIPEAHALTLPGRIYVARTLIAFAENEDEVAGVVAHEVGHGIAGDFERNMSTAFRTLLNVTAVGDARDIDDTYHRLLDAIAEGRRFDWSASDDAERESADRLAVWLMARAGYAPQAYQSVWNRVNELRPRAGSSLTDLVGLTSPAARRLPVTRAAADALPASCIGTRTATEKQFAEWRLAVLAAPRTTGAAGAPAPRGVRKERKLDPELRSTLSFLRFSPDGRHVLAQDDGSVYLFTREGLKFTYRLEAPDARHAQFSPDSSAVVFYDRNYRVERWGTATGAREWVREIVMTKPCTQSELSPDGAHLVCVTADREVRVYDVATGSTVFTKEFFIIDTAMEGLVIGASPGDDKEVELLKVRFSPDGRYLVLARNAVAMGVDLTTRSTIPLPGSIRDRVGLSFAFLSDGRIVGLHFSNPEQSGIVTFPEGKIVSRMNLGQHALSAPTHGDRYLLMGQVPQFTVGMFDLTEGKLKGGSTTPGFDVFDESFILEPRSGEIAVYKMGVTEPVSFATVPSSPLAWLRSASVDAEFTTLAASQNSRGAVWDLGTGKGLVTRAFRASFIEGTLAYLDFPGENNTQRAVVRIEPATQGAEVLVAIQEPTPRGGNPPRPVAAKARVSSQQYRDVVLAGPFLLASKVGTGVQPNTPAVLEAATGREVWTRPQPKSWPAAVVLDASRGTVTVAWPYAQSEAKAIIDAQPDLARKLEAQAAKKGDAFVIEVLDLATGAPRGRYVSTRLGGMYLPGRDLVVSIDKMNRTLVHALSTGELMGRTFGRYMDVDPQSGRVVVATGRRELTVYSLPRLEQVEVFAFPHDVSFARFGFSGAQLLVLTTGQTVYTLTVGGK